MALDAQRNWTVRMADDLHRVSARPAASKPPAAPVYDAGATRSLHPAPHLPVEILLQVVDYLALHPTSQQDLYAFSLVARSWYEAATPALYASPRLVGPRYDLFVRTICPSINVSVRKSPLSALIKELNLDMLVHQGSKSVTARLLGRTKGNLERFVAPMASMGLNCFPALAKCTHLRYLDLGLVSEATKLETLFTTVAGLHKLEDLRLPRSAGFGVQVDPKSIAWPSGLRRLVLSGGLDYEFWGGRLQFPRGIQKLCVEHCPKLDPRALSAFIFTLGQMRLENLSCLEFKSLPRLHDVSLDLVLAHLPHLPHLSVSVDYVSPELLNPFGVAWHSIAQPVKHDPLQHGPVLGLQTLELTDSGDPGDLDKFLPLDVHLAGEDLRTLPSLERVLVAASLSGWFRKEEEDNLDLLNDWLLDQARERGEQNLERIGVKRVGAAVRM